MERDRARHRERVCVSTYMEERERVCVSTRREIERGRERER